MSNPHKDQPEKYYPIRFFVEGSGRFPIDMLRYDRAVPVTESDSNTIIRCLRRDGDLADSSVHTSTFTVELMRYSSAGKSGPCVARWASFGWKVLRVEYPDGTVATAG